MEIDGKVIVESGAILTYGRAEGKLGPADGAKEDYTYWMHYAGSAMLPLLVKLITSGVWSAGPFLHQAHRQGHRQQD